MRRVRKISTVLGLFAVALGLSQVACAQPEQPQGTRVQAAAQAQTPQDDIDWP
ncbi:hypothetical protein [Streptomyces sp. bgisy091]|uniref:hypothetical protein n=1 Tax=Streptomyces sp. bgisy091 TaxID=3413778 RepID=UPI003D72CF6D